MCLVYAKMAVSFSLSALKDMWVAATVEDCAAVTGCVVGSHLSQWHYHLRHHVAAVFLAGPAFVAASALSAAAQSKHP